MTQNRPLEDPMVAVFCGECDSMLVLQGCRYGCSRAGCSRAGGAAGGRDSLRDGAVVYSQHRRGASQPLASPLVNTDLYDAAHEFCQRCSRPQPHAVVRRMDFSTRRLCRACHSGAAIDG
jgi:hypothetical protein